MGKVLNINALLAFNAVVSAGSAAAAARRLHKSQPAVSRLIAQLEHDLRLTLFSRERGRMVPTEEGLAFHREAARILDGLGSISSVAADIRARRTAALRIVAMPRTLFGWVAPATVEFHQRNPAVQVHIDVLRHHDLGSWLVGRRYDLGVGVLPIGHPQVDEHEILRARLCAVVRRGHALARRSSVRASQLSSHPLIGVTSGLMPRMQMDAVLRAAGVSSHCALETSATTLACLLVAQGAGITVLDALSAAAGGSATTCVPLEPREYVSFGLLSPRDAERAPGVHRYVAQLRERAEAIAKADPTRLVLAS